MPVGIKAQMSSSRFPRTARSGICSAGTFGRVLECWDRKNKDYVAVKIVRNVQKYRDAAMIEVHPLLGQCTSCVLCNTGASLCSTVYYLAAQDIITPFGEQLHCFLRFGGKPSS